MSVLSDTKMGAADIPAPLIALRTRAAKLQKHIVLSEGTDPRVLEAAAQASEAGLARISIVAPTGTAAPDGVTVHDPATSPHRAALITAFLEARAKKTPTQEQAEAAINDPLVFAALMVRAGLADGTIGGATHTTSDTVRAALQMIGKGPNAGMVSSFFVMVMPDYHPTRPEQGVVFSDCALVIEPSAQELGMIAVQAAASAQQLLGVDPKVAMLSFSTKGSAQHPNVTKMTEATEHAKAAGLSVDGELQFDAAFVPEVAASKAQGSAIAGQANVFIFPDINAGNIGYKIAQRIGGASAIGPILQGLAAPANDLSRGCSTEDILDMIAVTAVQADAS
ncbi:phosphate acetyltransferase [Thalassobacter stenotrophicus]|uniref:phosphate acetyltransferase n=1 Tax=Thalassobacter stenotrophicus TaxID=266809 RepID=UPI0022A91B52|nr:phosphate acetyltransferase [Thalassobacter stenotrophicus]UYP69245.1 phosphate acetyltransferase [Thalassobacter stenotrophicus]